MKKQNKYLVILVLVSASYLLFTHCGKNINCCVIKLPPVTFTSERTSLENQILGTYQEIKEDVWLVSSSQTVEGLKITSTTNTNIAQQQNINIKYQVIKAIETIEYDQEIVKEYKKKGYIGEDNKGLLSYRPNREIDNAPKKKEKIYEIINENNDARMTLMLEVIDKNEDLTLDDMDEVRKTFAKKYQTQTRPGEWFQDKEGEWRKK